MASSLLLDEGALGLMTDLGELAQAAGLFVQKKEHLLGTFELWVRHLPPQRNYLVYAGLEQAVALLQQFHFAPEQIEYLRGHSALAAVPTAWFEHLAQLRFRGDLWSVPEGTIVFAPEPLMRVTAPLDVGLIVGCVLLNVIKHQTTISSKTSRIVTAASGRTVIEMGAGHAPGLQASLHAARAAYLAGVMGTTHAGAARLLKIPCQNFMMHAWPMLYGDEVEAFQRYGLTFATTALPVADTYDPLQGVRYAIASGMPMQAVRLETGDLTAPSKEARKILDSTGRKQVKIFAGGDLDEALIEKLLIQGANLDGFVVGSELVESSNAPSLNCVYQLVSRQDRDGAWEGCMRLGPGKKSYPWAKQIFRQYTDDGSLAGDLIALETEPHRLEALMHPVLREGELVTPLPGLEEARDRCMVERIRIHSELLELSPAKSAYPVRYSAMLDEEAARLANRLLPRTWNGLD